MQERTERGSRVSIVFPATHAEIEQIIEATHRLIPPVPTTINGIRLERQEPETTFSASLETVLPDDEGNLRSRIRKTEVEVYKNGMGMLYELGVPVVETGDTFSYNVLQKTPLNLDRDNVPPAYLRKLRVSALNVLHPHLDSEDCNKLWVQDALGDKNIAPEAVQSAIKQRFGDKAVSFDPTDLEANNKAVTEGYTVVHGKQMSKDVWENVRKAGAIKPAGQVCPTPKPFSPDGKPLNTIPESEWTDGMRQVANYAKRLFKAWFNHDITVRIANEHDWCGACYGPSGDLYLNKGKLGNLWFERGITDDVVALFIHEGAHELEGNHLSVHYYDVLCELGAQMRNLKSLEAES
jgi:hypothetical protein